MAPSPLSILIFGTAISAGPSGIRLEDVHEIAKAEMQLNSAAVDVQINTLIQDGFLDYNKVEEKLFIKSEVLENQVRQYLFSSGAHSDARSGTECGVGPFGG